MITARHLQSSNLAGGLATERHLVDLRPRLRQQPPGETVVDAMLAQLLRHHTATREEFVSAIEFCQEQFSMRQLDVLLSHMGPRTPLMADDVHVERKNRGLVLRATIVLQQGVRWTSGRLCLAQNSIPDTAAAALQGRSLRSILDHPYMPDLEIGAVEELDGRLVILPVQSALPLMD